MAMSTKEVLLSSEPQYCSGDPMGPYVVPEIRTRANFMQGNCLTHYTTFPWTYTILKFNKRH